MAPLVSVLLPTRNRLEFLRYAIETVRRQDDGDWEIVVSDNDSEEDIAGHVAALGDDRIRYVRTAVVRPGDRQLEQRARAQHAAATW